MKRSLLQLVRSSERRASSSSAASSFVDARVLEDDEEETDEDDAMAGGLLFSSSSSSIKNKKKKKPPASRAPAPLPMSSGTGTGRRAREEQTWGENMVPITDFFKRPGQHQEKEPEQERPRTREEVRAQAHYALRQVFRNQSFRGQQERIIMAALEGMDVYVNMPTGGGKSLCYQLPAIITPGVTIVVSPLLSLIEDQVTALIRTHGIPAALLNSTTTETLARQIYRDIYGLRRGKEPYIKLLYVTPERLLKSTSFQDLCTFLHEHGMLARFVVDDFRPDYGQLGQFRHQYPEVPIMALTATATASVRNDIFRVLGLTTTGPPKERCLEFRAGFDRPNLFFEVRPKLKDKEGAKQDILDLLQDPASGCQGTGIVYCMSQKDCEVLADFLRDNNVMCDYYHAGQSNSERSAVLAAWQRGQVPVVCATIAMGMGVDVANVRFIIHATMAKSVEGYWQEAGRAGRDGKPARCVVFYRKEDVSKLKNLIQGPFGGKRRRGRGGKQNDLAKLHSMREYCENKEQCRRVLMGSHFGAAERVACHLGCDVCQRRQLGLGKDDQVDFQRWAADFRRRHNQPPPPPPPLQRQQQQRQRQPPPTGVGGKRPMTEQGGRGGGGAAAATSSSKQARVNGGKGTGGSEWLPRLDRGGGAGNTSSKENQNQEEIVLVSP